MGTAITLAQYLLDRDVAYELVPHPHAETALQAPQRAGYRPPSSSRTH